MPNNNSKHAQKDDARDEHQQRMSRRRFLQGLGFLVTTGGATALGIRVLSDRTSDAVIETAVMPDHPSVENPYPYIPETPAVAPDPDQLRVLTLEEALVVDALAARILPGTPEDPGASEANVVVYIDNMLAFNEGFVEATYREGPFAQTYEGDTPQESTQRFGAVPIAADQIDRYGYQHMLSPREVYRVAIAAIESYAESAFGSGVADLSEEQQDSIIQALLDNEISGFRQFQPVSFFHVLRRHVSEGMFSDPVYGGNYEMAGWRLIGYPGAQRSYDPDEIRGNGPPRPPQSIAQMNHFHPGENANDFVKLPVAGSDVDNLVDPRQQPSHSETEEK